MDCAIDTTSSEEGLVGCVDDAVDLELGDVEADR